MTQTLGIYVHVPFCSGAKCPYCDFYSVPLCEDQAQAYSKAAENDVVKYAPRARGKVVDTIYFGGGTPSLLGGSLVSILAVIKANFNVTQDAEITLEANPGADLGDTFQLLCEAGFNRLSIGMQSAQPEELRLLGRRHTPQDTAKAVSDAKAAGFENISLDLMIATPGQTQQSLARSIDFAASLGPQHLSAYLLKIEPNTCFYEIKDTMQLPDGDGQADFYLVACDEIESHGFRQYEISNFSLPQKESRHNLKYWNCDEYLGIGPGAHSYLDGKRFFYESSLERFIAGATEIDEGPGGGISEYIMLRLRLNEGLHIKELKTRYGCGFEIFNSSLYMPLLQAGYITVDENALRLTRKGMLMSNSVISTLLFNQSVE